MSPVCSMKSGGVDRPLILSIAACKVAATSGFAGLLKPMWLSLICTKLKSALFFASFVVPAANDWAVGIPPAKVQTSPVPAHAMHFRKPRRSMPSLFSSCNSSSIRSCELCVMFPPEWHCLGLLTGAEMFYSLLSARGENVCAPREEFGRVAQSRLGAAWYD